MHDEAPADLRTRRRADTHQEIHAAALELFEQQGVRNTTVQQIADRAGVSPRTFFRYFASKEQAGLPGQRRLLDVINRLEITDPAPQALLPAIEDAAEAAMSRDNDPDLAEHRRVAQLLARDPDLQTLAAAQEEVLTRRLRGRLAEQLPEHDATTILLAAEVAVAVWRACWHSWGECVDDGSAEDPVEQYQQCRRRLRDIVG